jgi:SNF2 family DNA or RNA helicase
VTIYCDFTEDQKSVYDQALMVARDEMARMEGARSFHILRLILRLRQIACHPNLAVKHSKKPLSSGKTEEVYHSAMEILSEGHKILVFSQFTRHLQLIESLFLRHKIPSFYLDGRTTDRAGVVQSFKAHNGPCLFFISLKTGGTGLNLSEASYVFLLDPWWNPAVENQAIDRCHRIGQHQPVTVYRFITRGSIEEKVDDLKTAKKAIESAVIDESVPRYLPFDERTMKSLIVSD